jgi:hypothetical protein
LSPFSGCFTRLGFVPTMCKLAALLPFSGCYKRLCGDNV